MRIRQPLAVLGFSFAGSLFICAWLTINQMRGFLAASCLLLFGGILLLWKRKGGMLLAVSLMAILAALFSQYRQSLMWDRWEACAGNEVILTGVVSEGDTNSGWVIQNAQLAWPENETIADVLLQGDHDLLLHSGEEITVKASVNKNLPSSSQQGRGVQLTARAFSPTLQVLSEQPWWEQVREWLLSHLQRGLRRAIPDRENAEFMIAVLTGNDNLIPRRTYGLFQRSGLAHILCVSGLHLSMLASIVTILFSLLGRRPALIAGLLGMAAFVWLTGSGPSAVRALIMTALAMAAELLYRDHSPVNALGGAVLIMTLMEPALVCRMGFLLSVASVLAITAAAPACSDMFSRIIPLEDRPLLRGLTNLLFPSIMISLLTLPVMLLFFGYIPLATPFFNMLVLPLMPLLLCCGLLAGVCSFVPAGIVCQKLLTWIRLVAALGAKGPILPLGSRILLICIIFSAVLAATVFLVQGKTPSRAAAGLLSLTILCWGSFMEQWNRKNLLSITQYAWRDGSSIVLQMGNQAVVVGCGGSAYEGRKLTNGLLAAGVSELSAVMIPADKLCYTGGAYDLLTALGASKVISPESSRILQALDFADIRESYSLQSSVWELFSCGKLTVRAGGVSAALILEMGDKKITLNADNNPVRYPADVCFFYNKKAAESETTRQNYAIMKSSGPLVQPAAVYTLEPTAGQREDKNNI